MVPPGVRPGCGAPGAYDRRVLSPLLLAIVGAFFLVLLAPTRRLRDAGWSARALGSYLGGMLVVGLLATELPGLTRLLVPIFAAGYIAPFLTLRGLLDRVFGGGRRGGRPGSGPGGRAARPPMKIVTGPARDVDPPADPSGMRR